MRLVLITLSHSARSSACGGLRILMPALLTRMSIRPSSRTTRSTMAATAALSVTSAATEIALAPPRVELGDRGVRLGFIAPDDRDRSAGFGQSARHAEADAAIAAGDDGHLAAEIE